MSQSAARYARLRLVPSAEGASSLLAPRDSQPHALKPRAVLSSTMGAGTLRPPPVASAPSIAGGVTPLRRLKERLLAETW